MHLCLAAAGLAAILLLARALAGRRALAAGAAFRRIALAICKQAEHQEKNRTKISHQLYAERHPQLRTFITVCANHSDVSVSRVG